MWQPSEVHLVDLAMRAEKSKYLAHVSESSLYSTVAMRLRFAHPSIFGPGSPGKPKGIQRQDVRSMLLVLDKHVKGQADNRGRPPALPILVLTAIIAACQAVLAPKAHVFSISMLLPVALAVIISKGYGSLVASEETRRKGRFFAGEYWLRSIFKMRGWRSCRPQGDQRKLPADWKRKCKDMVLRIAYFVKVYAIPLDLVINADHTGVFYTQVKGKGWITAEQAAAKDKSVQNHGDKRQFTCLASTAASGTFLKHQLVSQGKTSGCLPQFPGAVYKPSYAGLDPKQHPSACFTAKNSGEYATHFDGIGSMCCTHNHWSDDITSIAYIKDVFVPHVKHTCKELDLTFGEQRAILLLDMWWGWIDPKFKKFVLDEHPWIKLVYVPAACTPVGQPMDAGIIAMIKGLLRKYYGSWVVSLTRHQLEEEGKSPSEIKIPNDVQTCKQNLTRGLSTTVYNIDESKVSHCWQNTGILKAWTPNIQQKALDKAHELFPNLAAPEEPEEPDDTSAGQGVHDAPLTEDEAWELASSFVDWEAVPQAEDLQEVTSGVLSVNAQSDSTQPF